MYTVELWKITDNTFDIYVSDPKKSIDIMKQSIGATDGKIIKILDRNLFTLECDTKGLKRLLDRLYYECESHEIENIYDIFIVARFYF